MAGTRFRSYAIGTTDVGTTSALLVLIVVSNAMTPGRLSGSCPLVGPACGLRPPHPRPADAICLLGGHRKYNASKTAILFTHAPKLLNSEQARRRRTAYSADYQPEV